ncbi:MAG TPA: stalk domain-containing protein [Gemmatimonadales bacterium]|nr:stalk domain-containing protein [Gemmatimonadales bacterium]
MRLLAAILVTVAAVSPVRAQDQRIEPVLIELKLGRLAQRTVPAHRVGNDALIPLGAFFELAELRVQHQPNRIVAIVQPGNRRLEVRTTERYLTLDGRKTALSPRELLLQDDEVFLSARVLGDALGLTFDIAWDDLEVIAINPEELPVARRLRREEIATATLGAEPGRPQVDGRLAERTWPLEGAVLDYSVLVPTDPGPEGGAYSGTLGFNLFNGSLVAGAQNDGPVKDGKVRLDLSWLGVWPQNKYVSQLRIGDGFSSGPRTRALRGLAIGNVPFIRPSILGELPFTTGLGPGWDVEAYRGGRLIAFDSVNALGQFTLDVPIAYGDNPVDFIAYGPFGEVRQFNRTYRVSTDMIRAHRFEYALSGGLCRGDSICTATANADLRYGVTRRITMFAGVDQFWRDTLPNLFHPYAGLVAGLSNAFTVQGEFVSDAIMRGQLRFEPSLDLVLVAEATKFAEDIVAPILTLPNRQTQFTFFGQVRPIKGALRNWVVFDASFDRIQSEETNFTSARLGASIQPGQARFIPSIRWEKSRPRNGGEGTNQTLYGVNAVILPIRDLGSILGSLSARGGIEFTTPFDARNASAYLSHPIGRWVRLEAGGSWFTGTKVTLSAFLAADLPSVRAYTSMERVPAGSYTASQYVTGSLLYDATSRRVAFNAGPSVQQGGVSGTVFMDANANGRLDAGEYALPDVQVTVGLYSQKTNSRGQYRLWPLSAYDPVVAAVDTTTLASPLWIPAFSGIQLSPLPNRFTALDIPVLSGGVIEGKVTRSTSSGLEGLAGATLVLRHQATGKERRVATFTDGSFYVMGLRPGEWILEVDAALLQGLRATSDPVRIIVPSLVEGAAIGGVEVRVR